jgi:hypothetical protein
VTRRLLALVGGTLAFGLLVALAARAAWGDSAVAYSATAMALCLIPAAMTLIGSTWASTQPADKQLVMMLGGTGLRLAAVLAGGFILVQWVPYFREDHAPGFWMYVGAFYLFTLALETMLTVAGRPGAKMEIARAADSAPAEPVG